MTSTSKLPLVVKQHDVRMRQVIELRSQRYYTGKATAPLLTVVIGGNHEASNHLWELYDLGGRFLCKCTGVIDYRFPSVITEAGLPQISTFLATPDACK